MSTDLHDVHDHPVRIIGEWLSTLPVPHQERCGGIRAGEVLQDHERAQKVTFAALDNDALARVREVYEHQMSAEGMDAYDAAVDMVSAVADLLGLGD